MELSEGTYSIGEYSRFTIYDPKRRVIHAAAFRERVMHHALINDAKVKPSRRVLVAIAG